MSLDSLSLALSQIQYLINGLNKKNFSQYKCSVEELVATYGSEAEKHLLSCCLSAIDQAVVGNGDSSISTSKTASNSKDKDREVLQLLLDCFGPLINQPSFSSLIGSIIEQPVKSSISKNSLLSLKNSSLVISYISRQLRLTRSQEVVLRIGLLDLSESDSDDSLSVVRQKVGELLSDFVSQTETHISSLEGFQESSPEVIHFILSRVIDNPEYYGVTKELLEGATRNLRDIYPRDLVPVILAPLLYQEEAVDYTTRKMAHESSALPKNISELSLADLIMETGYSFTASLEECRNHLLSFGSRELSGPSVARALCCMARTHSGLDEHSQRNMRNGGGPPWPDLDAGGEKSDSRPTTWNMEVFVKAIMELAPNLSWKDVLYGLDHQGFFLKDRAELRVIIAAIQLGFQAQAINFPTEFLFQSWGNPEGQLSLLTQLLKNPDVLCLADHPHNPINVDILKSPPESENKKMANWKCIGLLEALLNLMENTGLCTQVQELLKEPMQQCPDVIVLGLLQSTQPMTKVRQELLSTLIPVFLGNHPNSAIILHHVWHAQSPLVKPLVMHAMAEWYMRAEHDQTRLSRILDLAQDLKALSMLLNVQRFPFIIDLACLASRREYLKLDKWLTDKMREHGETFVAACVNFLHQRCPQITGKKEDNLKAVPLPPDTITIMLSCLQVWTGNVSQELSETITTMVSNCTALNRARAQPPPGVMKNIRPGSGVDVTFPPGTLNSQLFPPPGVDSLSGLSATLGSMALGPPTSSGFGVSIGPNTLPGSTAAPGSPGKVFPGMSMLDSGINQSTIVGLPTSTNPSQVQNTFSIFSSLTGSGTIPGSSGANPIGLGLPNTVSSGSNAIQSAIGASALVSGSVGSPGSVVNGPPVRVGVNPHMGQERRAGDVSSAFADMPQTVSKDIEDETNSYFQRIYNQSSSTPTLTVDEVLDLLKKFQNSSNRREREIFDCMLRNLFEEYRFFPQYPDRELHITAQLFGGIMEHGLVTYMALGVALRYVLEALRKPHGTKMYYFGITALDRFRHRLKEYPQYCQHLASIPHFREFPAHLIEYIENGSRGVEPPNRPHGPVLPQAAAAPKTNAPATPTTTTSAKTSATTGTIGGRPSIANATNIDTLLVASEKDDQLVVPPENVQDKVSFIFNNISQINLTQKCEELREIVGDDHWSWVAQYLVMKRASIEPNFHTLYSNFLDTLKLQELSRLVVNETFRNIKVLLRSDKGIANFSDRSLLKNLGHWLGLLMLAKNRPILQADIDFKSILIEAYHKGQQELLYIVPFVAKVLESCAKSKVFKPPNPWTLGIMNVLAELHQEPDLKLNLKFEIEVLCKTLTIDIHDLKPGMVFKDHSRLSRLEPQLSQPQVYQASSQLPVQPQQQAQPQPQQQQQQPPPPPQQQQQQQQAQQPQPQTQQPPPQLAGSPAQMQSQTGTTTPTPTHAMPVPPEPRFSYLDINVSSLAALAQHLVVNNNIPLLTAHPNLRILIRPAVERAVQECIAPVVDWSMKIALTTCEQIIKKDFSLDPDENRMRAAAHHMVRSLSAGTALIRCRDHLLVTIASNLKSAFLTTLRTPIPQQKELVEQAATLTAQDNVEPACAFIQKTAVEKSIAEIDKRLATEFELRKHARNEGRRYYDPAVFAYQAERMPEPIRLKITGVTPQQAAVYEEFARYIPGFLPINERDAPMLAPKMVPAFANDEIGVILEKVALELERYLQTLLPINSAHAVAIGALLEAVMLARTSRDHGAHVTLLQKAFEGLVESLTSFGTGNDPETVVRFRDAHLLVLKALQDPQAYGLQWTNRQVTRCWAECREEFRYNLDILDCLLRAHLINLQQFDIHLASVLEQALNPAGVGSAILALGFAMQLVHVYLLEGPASGAPILITENDLVNTIEILTRIAAHARQPPEGLATILELLRSSHESGLMDRAPGGPGGPTALIHSGIAQARDYDDPPSLPEKTEYLLQEWVAMYHLPNAGRDSSKAFGHFVTQMSLHGVLKTDDLITRFFRLCTQFCVDIAYRALASEPTPDLIRSKAFHSLDAYVRLIALLIKHSGDANNGVTKVNLLNKVLGIVAGTLLQDQEVRGAEFQQLAYHRILIMLFLELNAPEQVLDSINFQVLTAFCHTLHILRPAKAPGFAYAWLEIVSHRVFIGRLLSITPQQKGWGMYAQLLIDLFKFLAPFLRNAELSKPVSMLYKGTLRVLLVLLHDFPEFLCDYHYGFCDVIPPNCIQMRNLILSAFPRNMRLPDPFTPNLKVDMLPEISHAPRVLTHFAAMIQPPTLKKDLDSYLKTRGPVTFLSELRSVVQVHISSMNLHMSPEPGMRYNLPLLNALVLYVGTQAIQSIQTKGLSPSMATIGHSSYMDIFQSLAVNLDTEGRYLFINAIANQLRYPNSHTHYFSCVLLCLFAEANSEAIQEQITRVLLERLIVNRPHPWGLLITFIELIKNPVFKFWNHEFVHCAPEIEKLFESVARSCMVQKQNPRDNENHE